MDSQGSVHVSRHNRKALALQKGKKSNSSGLTADFTLKEADTVFGPPLRVDLACHRYRDRYFSHHCSFIVLLFKRIAVCAEALPLWELMAITVQAIV